MARCKSTIQAPSPFPADKGANIEHQCAGSPTKAHTHYCGCGHQWTDAVGLVTDGTATDAK